ncbi:DUF1289 domain-containing protein [Thalassospira alkalitolerans]|uniref:DUF1289 domain-containing protein n=1 Tax=Thalassospira alkalitolerans TaxID=1293890 RepID=UPI000A1F620E|nr:DUF1289 domain-containing protein [Thalassospira alkalitolerans]
MPVKSPCIGICVLDPTADYCTGCYRTGDEIGAWMGMSDGGKKRVLDLVRKRRQATVRPSSKARQTKS